MNLFEQRVNVLEDMEGTGMGEDPTCLERCVMLTSRAEELHRDIGVVNLKGWWSQGLVLYGA